ncbi:MAG TPA: hypothetical protein VNK23_07580 [Candidatus Dormibacteraeota bacterium]|nr:hypothetical protein [Candidatus Dormibacteraeota bacterium]
MGALKGCWPQGQRYTNIGEWSGVLEVSVSAHLHRFTIAKELGPSATGLKYRSGRGRSLDGPGPVVADGMAFVASGYGQWGGAPGNLL